MSRPARPRHLGIIPDGNRRWAARRGLGRQAGYASGIEPGLRLYRACRAAGVERLSVYGFTKENRRRPRAQVAAFTRACVRMAEALEAEGASVEAVGDRDSAAFPPALRRFLGRRGRGPTVHLLVNYGWAWDLAGLRGGRHRTAGLPAVDMVVRWGGGRRLSGFLPVQSAYADLFVVEDLWPDFRESHLFEALAWYARQDRTMGG